MVVTWWCPVVESMSHGSHVMNSRGGVSVKWLSCGEVTWWSHVMESCGGVAWWSQCHVVVT
jgi:hypothetical protein